MRYGVAAPELSTGRGVTLTGLRDIAYASHARISDNPIAHLCSVLYLYRPTFSVPANVSVSRFATFLYVLFRSSLSPYPVPHSSIVHDIYIHPQIRTIIAVAVFDDTHPHLLTVT